MSVLRQFARRTAGAGRPSAIVVISLLGLAPASNCVAAVVSPFSNTTPITINDAPQPPPDVVAKATPYPSVIHVSGIAGNTITKVQVILSTFSHAFPDDVDILLVAPDGTRSIVMSDSGGGVPVSNLQLTFSATAAAPVPDNTAISDSAPLRPANYAAQDDSGITDIFPSPGPGTVDMDPADFDAFNGINPNGDWSLYVVDDSHIDSGSILGGWTLVLTVPTVWTVTKTADTNDGVCNSDCSLREAIAAAGDGDLIRFASPLFDTSQTITLGGTELIPSKSVTIEGPGADRLSISANNTSAVFAVANGLAVTLKGMTIRDGNSDVGGGIISAGQLTLQNVALTANKANGSGRGGAVYQTGNGNYIGCTFSDNQGKAGGAIFVAQPAQFLRLVNSTVSSNQVVDDGDGGGISLFSGNASDVRLEIIDSTITNNKVPNGVGGGISVFTEGVAGSTATVTLRNSIIANNSPSNLSAQADTGAINIESQGFNLTNDATSLYPTDPTDILGVDPKLGPLNNNGGHVETRALLGGSPALDAGHSSGYPKDQRGLSRSFDAVAIDVPGDYSDIGAAEMHAIFVSTTADSDTGSLRQAMLLANSNSPSPVDILFDPNVFATPQTINLASALPDINTSLSVNGPGAKLLTVRRDTGGDYRIFNVNGGYEAAFSGLTISNGAGSAGAGLACSSRLALAQTSFTGNSDTSNYGGGGLALFGADGTIKDSTFSGNNTGGSGGGILFQGNQSVLRVTNTTISANVAGFGGGISTLNLTDGLTTLELASSTIANNTAPANGGVDVYTQDSLAVLATARLRNSIVANNSLPNLGVGNAGGGAATIVSLGYNLTDDATAIFLDLVSDQVNTDPMLRPLADNGGPTKTHALKPGSPALDAGDRSGSNADQRGYQRPYDQPGVTNVGDGSDIGALEQDDTLFRDGFDG
ncbi:MAG TPA: choice-of-anchor Q domain-containing protein [Rudaea sp.]|jgi:CSLREA domain-containing protein